MEFMMLLLMMIKDASSSDFVGRGGWAGMWRKGAQFKDEFVKLWDFQSEFPSKPTLAQSG